jgi:hypothetical protein
MPLPRPILDDRSYEQLRNELIRRIPVYNREWTDHNPSDPGITLVELFAFLAENLLYRFNQIPETTWLEFLRLLQIPLRPVQPAQALVTMRTPTRSGAAGEDPAGALIPLGTEVQAGDIPFETRTEVRVLPVSCVAVAKVRCDKPAEPELLTVFQDSEMAAQLTAGEQSQCYQTARVGGQDQPVDFDAAVDGMLWVAVLTEMDSDLSELRRALTERREATPTRSGAAGLLLNLGFVPDPVPASQVDPGATPPREKDLWLCPGTGETDPVLSAIHWQISTGELVDKNRPRYADLTVEGDTTKGLSQEGVVRLRLPRTLADMGVFVPDDPGQAGTRDLPPVLEDADEKKILFWLRAFRPVGPAADERAGFGKVVHVGLNAAEVVQQRRARAEYLGNGTGQPNQAYPLTQSGIMAGSLVVDVEGPQGWKEWTAVDGFHASGRSDRHYVLDAEAGVVRFGNGLQGYPPPLGQRIRARTYLVCRGAAGNVPAQAISKLANIAADVEVTNPMRAHGGDDAESAQAGLDRIPGELRRRDRAVTADDFKELALMTPGGGGSGVGRAECLPRFHPDTRRQNVAGAVTVVVWPKEDPQHPDAPVPGRPLLRRVCCWLDRRRLITTELYVIGPRYHPIQVSVGLRVKQGYGIEAVRRWAELILRQYVAPLPPYGPDGHGWPLGRKVIAAELQAAVLQVEGVEYLEALKLADGGTVGANDYSPALKESLVVEIEPDEVIELKSVTVVANVPADRVPAPGQGPQPEPPPVVLVPIPTRQDEC